MHVTYYRRIGIGVEVRQAIGEDREVWEEAEEGWTM
jgi:hypothetical protein